MLLITCCLLLTYCKKEFTNTKHVTINVVNASVGAGALKVNSYGRNINWSFLTGTDGAVNYASNMVYTLFNQNSYPFVVVPALDTLKTVFREPIPNETGTMYTLFTTGQNPNYESVLIKEATIPYGLTDSVVAVRFINLSPNSPAINITLENSPTVIVESNLSYKKLSSFKNLQLLKIIPPGSITFQVRDAATNGILTTYTLPVTASLPYSSVTIAKARFNSITLVIKGLSGTSVGTNAYSIFPVAHFQ